MLACNIRYLYHTYNSHRITLNVTKSCKPSHQVRGCRCYQIIYIKIIYIKTKKTHQGGLSNAVITWALSVISLHFTLHPPHRMSSLTIAHSSTHDPPHKQWLVRLGWVVMSFVRCWGLVCCVGSLWCCWCRCWHPSHWLVIVVVSLAIPLVVAW